MLLIAGAKPTATGRCQCYCHVINIAACHSRYCGQLSLKWGL